MSKYVMTLRLDYDLQKRLQDMAEAEERSLASVIRRLLKQALGKRK